VGLAVELTQAYRKDTERRGWPGDLTHAQPGPGYEADWRIAAGTKQQILKAIEEFPDDAGVEDGLYRLYLLYKVATDLALTPRGGVSMWEIHKNSAPASRGQRYQSYS